MLAYQPHDQASGGSLLFDLHRAHEDVLGGMEELGRLTRDSGPDEQLLCKARWKLSQASMRRRLLWARILGHLAPIAEPGVRNELMRLQELDIELLGVSTAHIGQWTTESIVRDWPGYCAASREMRRKMIARMEEEKRILYPLLREGRTTTRATRSGVSGGSISRPPDIGNAA